MERDLKTKYFVFSDESGSWHDPKDIYVRSWIVVSEKGHALLLDAIKEVNSKIGCTELKWKNLARNPKFISVIGKFDHRVFLTISSPADIKWETKYKITREFDSQVDSLDFGELDKDLVKVLKKKMYDDIRNILFLHFYERIHIANAKLGIESVLPKKDNLLIYRIDPPQMSQAAWKEILHTMSPGIHIEFPKSQSNPGIQYADAVAGCVRSFLIGDEFAETAKVFIRELRPKLTKKDTANPNPNLIFFKEINDLLKTRSSEIWTA